MSLETDQNKVASARASQDVKNHDHDSEINLAKNSTEQQLIQTEQDPPEKNEQDSVDKIRERIEVVYKKIDEKRRRLLLKDREFIIVNLKDLQDTLTKIIQAVEDSSSSDDLDSNSVEANAVEANTVESQSLGDRSFLPSPGKESFKNYFTNSQKSLPKELRFDLNDLIEELENDRCSIQQHYETLTRTYHQSDIKTIYGQRDRLLLDELQGRLDEFNGRLDEFNGQLNVLVNVNQQKITASSSNDLTKKIEYLQAEIQQANNYIEALQGNCRSEVARQLNHIKALLGRIHMYTGMHESLHNRALLSLVERVNLAVSDAECGSSCTLELLRETEVCISRIMYRYEYRLLKLPIGWSINRINDGKRLVGNIKDWHNSQNDFQPNVIKSKVLLGLTITSSFWVLLFLTVSGLLISARVAIAIFTPSAVQEKVEQENTQLNDIDVVAQRVLDSSQIEVKERIEGHIADINYLINLAKADLLSNLSNENKITSEEVGQLLVAPSNDEENRINDQIINDFDQYCSFDADHEVTNNTVTECTQAIVAISAPLGQGEDRSTSQGQGKSPQSKLVALQDSLSILSRLFNDKADLEEIHDNTQERFEARLLDLRRAIQGVASSASSEQSARGNSRLGETSTLNNPWQTLTRSLFSWSRDDALNGPRIEGTKRD